MFQKLVQMFLLTLDIFYNSLLRLIFNNHPSALIFGSFDQAKEQRFHFKIHHLKIHEN
jgi:hypothetical protein